MASKAFEGNYKAWLLSDAPAGLDFADGGSVVTETELNAGTRLLRLISDGGVGYSYTMNTASQALIDTGKVSHNVGTREITGGQITHEFDFPLDADAMYALSVYGDARFLVVSPDGIPDETGQILYILQTEMGEPQPMASARDSKQNFVVGFATQEWDFVATFATP
jgi:hypothetical protein